MTPFLKCFYIILFFPMGASPSSNLSLVKVMMSIKMSVIHHHLPEATREIENERKALPCGSHQIESLAPSASSAYSTSQLPVIQSEL